MVCKTSQIQASSVALHSLLTVTARFSRNLEVQVHSHTGFISFLLIFHAVKTCLFSAEVRHIRVFDHFVPLFQGLLSMKVGHFFGMSQAENASIHQNYMVRNINIIWLVVACFSGLGVKVLPLVIASPRGCPQLSYGTCICIAWVYMFSKFVQFGEHNSVLQATYLLTMLGGQPWDSTATCSLNQWTISWSCYLLSTTSGQSHDSAATCSPQPVDNLMTVLLPAHHNQWTISWQCCYMLTTTSGQSHDSGATCSPQPIDNLKTVLLPADHNQWTISWQSCYLLTTISGQSHDNAATCSPQSVDNLMTVLLATCTCSPQLCSWLTSYWCYYLLITTLWQSCYLLPQQADRLVTRLLTA